MVSNHDRISPSCHEIVENDAVGFLIPFHGQSGAAASKKQCGRSHLQVVERLYVKKSCASSVAHIAEGPQVRKDRDKRKKYTLKQGN